ncbi:hypothetical protein GIB67_032298 [Kingdonia uniflora]|uniref:ATP-dependent DNA helicase n=1 Tax=Kingdonia uniflora TaxID=39325 RepID=A0A7J7MXH8_9MAGN|nr:hypothetical protein GIB67_032298 [Kingdonia uniflora]
MRETDFAKDSKAIKEILISKHNTKRYEENTKKRGDARLYNIKESNIHVDIDNRYASISRKDYSASIPMHSTSTLTSSILKSTADVIPKLSRMLTKTGGDFRQVLLVTPRFSRAETVNVCIANSYVWKVVKVTLLKENMRATIDINYSEFLLKVGNGECNVAPDDGMVRIPDEIVLNFKDGNSIHN